MGVNDTEHSKITNKTVLVTGGAGFIGSNLVRHLSEMGNMVWVLDNFSSGYHDNIKESDSVRIITGDIRIRQALDVAMRSETDVIFHLAASVGNKRSIEQPLIDADINVIGTLMMLEMARKKGVKKIVVSSSAGIFGELKTLPIKEDHPAEPDSPYGCSKLYEEKISLSYSRLYDMNITCLRYFNVYGPNQRYDAYSNVIPIFVKRMLKGDPLTIYGDGEQTRDFVHVDDVIQANIKAAESDASGVFNIGSGQSITINKLAHLISEKIQYREERKGDVRDSLADISLAKEKLGYHPTIDLEQGIKNYIEWARASMING